MNEELINSDREKTAQFLSKAQSGALQAGLSPAQREKINQYVIEQRNIYVNNALIAQEFDKSTPAYMEAIQNMNGVRNNLSNLANQQKSIAENQKQYLDDFSSDRISKANYDPSNPTMLTDVYTGKADMEIGEGGNIYFGDGKTYKPYADIADYSLKAYDTSNDLLDVSNKVYNSKYRLGAASIQQAKNWVQNVIEKGGRKNLLSLIYDGLIPGVDETQFPKDLYKPENYGGLKKAFLDKYGLALDEINNALPTIPTKAVTSKTSTRTPKRKNILTEEDFSYFTRNKTGEASDPFYFTMKDDLELGYNEYKSPKHTIKFDQASKRWLVETPGHTPRVYTESELRDQIGLQQIPVKSPEQTVGEYYSGFGSKLNSLKSNKK